MSKLFTFFSMLVLVLSVNNQAFAQQKLVVAGYGGSFEDIMRKDIFPPFEKKHNVKIDFVAGNSTNTVARLQAQKGNQEIDVCMIPSTPHLLLCWGPWNAVVNRRDAKQHDRSD